MTKIPSDNTLDSSLALLLNGYNFGRKRREELKTDIFQTRLMFKKTIFLCGEEWSSIYHDNEHFSRKGAPPKRVQKTLFGEGGLQAMEDEPHRNRKKAFMSLMTEENLNLLSDIYEIHWQKHINKWEKMEHVSLFEESQELFCRGICEWSGVPLKETEVRQRSRDFIAMIESFGAVGPRYWRGKSARKRAEKWMVGIIEQVRSGKLKVAENSATHVMAFHQELNGEKLSSQVAAVELINVLRPTVAMAYFVSFLALALHDYPECREKLKAGEEGYDELFIHEVRRFYPFAPFTGAKVRKEFEWKGYVFPEGTQVFMDIYGTNHDPRIWDKPEEFKPERFLNWNGSPNNFIPQGGGSHNNGHRCAGEWITINGLKQTAKFLTRVIDFKFPKQDLSFSMSRIPTFPKSGIVINKVKRIKELLLQEQEERFVAK